MLICIGLLQLGSLIKNMKKILFTILFISLIIPQYCFAGYAGVWKMEGNSNDYSGNSNNAVDTSISYGSSYGVYAQGAKYTSSSYNALTDSASLDWDINSHTWSLWLNTSQIFSNTSWLIGHRSNAAVAIEESWISATGSIAWQMSSAGGGAAKLFYTPISILPNVWNHIVLTRSGSNYIIYINGKQSASISSGTGGDTYGATAPLTKIGNYSGGGTNGVNGYIDEVILDNSSAWSAQRVKTQYSYNRGIF